MFSPLCTFTEVDRPSTCFFLSLSCSIMILYLPLGNKKQAKNRSNGAEKSNLRLDPQSHRERTEQGRNYWHTTPTESLKTWLHKTLRRDCLSKSGVLAVTQWQKKGFRTTIFQVEIGSTAVGKFSCYTTTRFKDITHKTL